MKAPKLGEMRWSLQVVRRVTTTPAPWSAEVDHTYTPVITTRAKADTKQGVAEFNRVMIEGKEVTHVFTIRFTTIPFDVRDRLRDAVGNLYQILSVESVDMGRRWMRIHACLVGATDKQSVT